VLRARELVQALRHQIERLLQLLDASLLPRELRFQFGGLIASGPVGWQCALDLGRTGIGLSIPG